MVLPDDGDGAVVVAAAAVARRAEDAEAAPEMAEKANLNIPNFLTMMKPLDHK